MKRRTACFRNVGREYIPGQLVGRPTVSTPKRIHAIVEAAKIDDAVDNGR
jgi:hypothetical protein